MCTQKCKDKVEILCEKNKEEKREKKKLRWRRNRGGRKWTLVRIKVQSRSKLRSSIHCFQGVSESALINATLLATVTA